MKNEKIGEILSRHINAMGLSKQFAAARVCAVANEAGKGEFEVVSYKNGVLKVHVDSGARAHLIKLREVEILRNINKKLGKDVVKRLVFDIA